ncbi:MAG TPA: transposase [Actinobacteria bacterium]|nr:transposase [Actinomycetota bacterium]
MAAQGLPELDVARVQRWCDQRVPDHARDKLRIECETELRHLTIVERRPPWREGVGPKWTRSPVARLHYTKANRAWTLYWHDRNSRFHLYRPTRAISTRGRPSIFWG